MIPVPARLRPAVRSAGIWTGLHRRRFDTSSSIVISAVPRSGSTWVAEQFAACAGVAALFEPLHLREVPGAEAAGFGWRTDIAVGADRPTEAAFLRQAMAGRVLNGWTTSLLTAPTAWRAERLAVKFVRASRLLGFLDEVTDPSAIVVLLRDPAAVVQSQLRAGWNGGVVDAESSGIAAYPDLVEALGTVTTAEEALAVSWAVDVRFALERVPAGKAVVAFYEELRDPATHQALLEACGLEPPADLEQRMARPSRTAGLGRARSDLLDTAARRRVQEVTRRFGVDLYEDGQPRHDALARFALPPAVSAR